jgi:uncharacterized cupredoxin-like copper-binding protein
MYVHRVRGSGPAHYSGPTCLPLGPRRQRESRESRRLLFAFAAAALVVAATGCGGGGGGTASVAAASTGGTSTGAGSGKATTLHLQADPSGALRFDKTTLSASAGNVTIVMANPSPLRHDVAIQGNGVDVTGAVVSKGGTSTVSATLKPGTYTFLCTVDGHADAGMKGTLTVS